ncbi:DEAD/DEAH box helicase, partial [Ameyamaea chiangmaiensis]
NAGAHIVVGTPGRLCDHLNRGNLDLSGLRAAVLDEADEMLDLGFREELETLLDAAPADRRTLLFSATIAREIASLARRYQRDALRIDTASGAKQHADITYRAVVTMPQEIGRSIVNVLRYYESETAMLFCGTREMVRQVQSALMERGFASVAISGEMGQNERTRAIESLRSGQARVCVATDVAARGIDIPALGLVIHGNLPTDPATFLHRSGRTGRAGRKGTCVVMVPVSQRGRAQRLLAGAKVTADWDPVPTAAMVRERDAERLLDSPILTETGHIDPTLVTKLTEAHDKDALATALVRLYQQRLPAVEDLRPLSVDTPRPTREERHTHDDRAPRDSAPRLDAPGAWYRLSVGRRDKADPKWLVPLICRLGGVKKRDIGSIRIGDEHTEFEISPEMTDRFNACMAATEADEVQVSAIDQPTVSGSHGGPRGGPRGPRPA